MLSRDRVTASSNRRLAVAVACSREQEGLWILEQTRHLDVTMNFAVALDFVGDLDVRILEEALRSLIARHPALRTQYVAQEGRLSQIEHPASVADAFTLKVMSSKSDSWELESQLARQPVSLEHRRPFTTTLVRSDQEHSTLVLVAHQAALDAESLGIVLHELAASYETAITNDDAPFDPRADDYHSFVADEQAQIDRLAPRAGSLWRPALAAIDDAVRLPRPFSRTGPSEEPSGLTQTLIEPDLEEAVHQLGLEYGTSLFVTLLAAIQILQCRYGGGATDTAATAVSTSRRPRALRDAVGMFANDLPLLGAPSPDLRIGEFLDQIRSRAQALFALRRFPFTEALARFGPSSSARGSAVEVGVTYLKLRPVARSLPGLEIHPPRLLRSSGNRRPLTVWLYDDGSDLRIHIDVDPSAVAPELAGSATRHLKTVLRAIASDPQARLGQIDLLSRDERDQIMEEFNDTSSVPGPARRVTDLFEAQVEKTPGAPAVVFEHGDPLRYEEVNARANQVAHRLRRLGVGPDVPVGLCVDRSPDLVIGMLGILKAGGAYVPLDPQYPTERLRLMISDSQVGALVSQRSLRHQLPAGNVPVLLLDDTHELSTEPSDNPEPVAEADDLAYVIFTSGSTGIPKGVAMPHRGLCNLLEWEKTHRFRDAPARTLQFASASFDVAFQEIFSTLSTGGCLVLVGSELRSDFDRLTKFILDASIERLFLPFLALNEFARRVPAGRTDVELDVITAGEQLEITPAIRRAWTDNPQWTLENQYGPTESHVVTSRRLTGTAERWPTLPPIGRPISNARIHVLDPSGMPVPVGVPGELHIGGVGLARGYLNRPELTRERFIADLFGPPGSLLYRTGDLARWCPEGTIEFLGRLDHQVKIRGFRIEPGEIEVALAGHPSVHKAAVIPREDPRGDRALVAYVVAEDGAAPTSVELRAFLGASLPDYMVPAVFIALDDLPFTPNGKLDRDRLPAPEWGASGETSAPPQTPMERLLASIWTDVLGLPQVGVDDNFFVLGGHSLLAAEVIARARTALDLDLPLRLIFAGPTVAEMARALEERSPATTQQGPIPRAQRPSLSDVEFDEQIAPVLNREGDVAGPPGSREPVSAPIRVNVDSNEPDVVTVAASLPQERELLASADLLAYENVAVGWRLAGPLDVGALRVTLAEIVQRHEPLRCTLATTGSGKAVQVIPKEVVVPFEYLDLRGVGPAGQEGRVTSYIQSALQRRFKLTRGPLVRGTLIRLSSQQHLFLLLAAHAVWDGLSAPIFAREFAALYSGYVTGGTSALPSLAVQLGDVADWEHGVTDPLVDSYWREQLRRPPPPLALPIDRARAAFEGYVPLTESVAPSPPWIGEALGRIAQAAGTTLATVVLTAFAALLRAHTGQQEFAIGVFDANRDRAETEPLIGDLTNVLPLRVEVSDTWTFRQMVASIARSAQGAYAHRVPLRRIAALKEAVHDNGNPLPMYDVALNFRPKGHQADSEALKAGDLRIHAYDPPVGYAQFRTRSVWWDAHLDLNVDEDGAGGMSAHFSYNGLALPVAFVAELARDLDRLLRAMALRPDGQMQHVIAASE